MTTVAPEEATKWRPYHYSWAEVPSLFFLRPLVNAWISIRNFILKNPFLTWRLPFPCNASQVIIVFDYGILIV